MRSEKPFCSESLLKMYFLSGKKIQFSGINRAEIKEEGRGTDQKVLTTDPLPASSGSPDLVEVSYSKAPSVPRSRERARAKQDSRTAGLAHELNGSAGNAFTAAPAAAWGRSDPRALARLAALLLPEEVKLVNSDGRKETYTDSQGRPISIEEIAILHGRNLLMNLSSCRELPLGKDIFGGEFYLGKENLLGHLPMRPKGRILPPCRRQHFHQSRCLMIQRLGLQRLIAMRKI